MVALVRLPGQAQAQETCVHGSVVQAVVIERTTCLRMSLPKISAMRSTAKS